MPLSDFSLNFIPFLKTVVVFIIWLTIAPMAYNFNRRQADVLTRLFSNLLQGIFFTAVVVYLLVILHIFEFISLITVFVAAWALAVNIRGNNPLVMIQDRTIIGLGILFDWIEKPLRFKERVASIFSNTRQRTMHLFKNLTLMDMVTILFLIFLMGLRFYPRFKQVNLPMSDPYVHLTWVKMMINNHLFRDGVYPLGYHTIIAALKVMSNLDPYHILRYMGPLGGSLLVLGFYWFLRQISGSRFIALLGCAAFGLSTTGGLPVGFFRQITSLPMEFSMALVFPGLFFLNNYFCQGDRRDLFLFGIATADVCLIHSFGALFMALGAMVLFISAILNRVLTLDQIKNILPVGMFSALLGLLPIVIGKAMGLPWHASSTSFVAENIKFDSWAQLISGFWSLIVNSPHYIFVFGMVISGGLVIASIYYALIPRQKRNLWPFSLMSLSVIGLALFYGPAYGGFSLLDPDRAEMFMSMCVIAASVFGLGFIGNMVKSGLQNFGLLDTWLGKNSGRFLPGLVLAVFCIFWLNLYPLQLNLEKATASEPLEYDSAARTYFNIKNQFPPLDWTLIAPVEQYNEALGYGYTYELWQFNQDFALADAQNPKFDIPIPTTYMFIFIEKIPLQIWKNYVAPAGAGPTEKYYRSASGRTQLEAEMAKWCEAYMASHKNMSVYYEDKYLIVYQVEHNPLPFVVK